MTDLHYPVPASARKAVAAQLLEAADNELVVRTTSDGFTAPEEVWDEAFPDGVPTGQDVVDAYPVPARAYPDDFGAAVDAEAERVSGGRHAAPTRVVAADEPVTEPAGEHVTDPAGEQLTGPDAGTAGPGTAEQAAGVDPASAGDPAATRPALAALLEKLTVAQLRTFTEGKVELGTATRRDDIRAAIAMADGQEQLDLAEMLHQFTVPVLEEIADKVGIDRTGLTAKDDIVAAIAAGPAEEPEGSEDDPDSTEEDAAGVAGE